MFGLGFDRVAKSNGNIKNEIDFNPSKKFMYDMKNPYLIVPGLAVPVAAAPDPEPALDGDGAMAGAGPRDGVLEDLH